MQLSALTAVSSLDGRYRKSGAKLAEYMSEFALIRARVRMQIEYLIALSELEGIPLGKLSQGNKLELRKLANISEEDARIIKLIETKGYEDIPATNHDVVAVISWLKKCLRGSPLAHAVEWLHFGLTSEDCNNIAYAMMLRDAIRVVVRPEMINVVDRLGDFAKEYATLPMLSRTHGQAATPTTLGKEFNVFAKRLDRQITQLNKFTLLVKLNGASGNYCAHMVAFPGINWEQFAAIFILSLNTRENGLGLDFEPNPVTTQIEPHDTYAELFGIIMRFNTILVDCSQDIWRYISDGWLVQTPVAGEVGSSAMPHKVNPINFENAEGNLLFANAMMEFFNRKLPISRLQRDLSDSTVERNFGSALGHSLIGYEAMLSGLGKISADKEKIESALGKNWEVLAEAIQTILRADGQSDSYNLLKDISRGRRMNKMDIRNFVETLHHEKKVSDEAMKAIFYLTPWNYTGLAAMLARP